MPEPSGSGAQAAPANKPRLKINVSRTNSMIQEASATPGSAAPAQTPNFAQTPGSEGHRKVKLKITSSVPATPAIETTPSVVANKAAAAAITASTTPAAVIPAGSQEKPAKTKAGRQPKPTQRLIESKKRARDADDGDDDDDEDKPLAAKRRTSGGAHGPTRIKIRPTPKSAPTQLVVKPRGRPPHHPPGDGYDSDASDREIDPAIEEQFVLRMIPGEHCDYMRWCMENGKIGVHKSQGGADVQLRFFEEESRRGVITVKGQPYAAVMVDLPTITEAMKTWDRKQFMKSADICQMLLVFAKVKDEQEARRVALPKILESNFKWPHGLTPPMHDCVNRRFAKTISRKEIEDKEAEVERLLQEDAKAASTKWEWVDERQEDMDEDDGADEDAEGEVDESVDYFGNGQAGYGEQEGEASDDDLVADLEAAFASNNGQTSGTMDTATPGADTPSATATTPAAVANVAGVQPSIEMDSGADGVSEDEDDEDDDDDDDDDDDEDEDLDDDQRAERDEHHAVLSMIKDLEKQMASKSAELAKMPNRILKSRIEQQIKQLKSEIDLKKSSIGLDTDD